MSRVEAFVRFLWDFIVGDDWRIAACVVVALAATSLIAGAGIAAWWALPVAVAVILTVSLASAARRSWRASRRSRACARGRCPQARR